MFSPRTALVLLLLVAAAALPALAQEEGLDGKIRDKESELQRLRREIAEQRRTIAGIEAQEKDTAGLIRRLEEEARLTRSLLAGLGEKEELLAAQADTLRRAIDVNEAVYRFRLGTLARRLREMYKDGTRRTWQELLGARDFGDLLQRWKFLSLIAERDAGLISDVRERRAEIERQEAEVTEVLHEVSVSRREKEGELGRLDENERKRRRALADLRGRRAAHEKRAEELAAAESQLQDLIEILEARRAERAKAWGEYGEADFTALRGRMTRPADGRTVRPFGKYTHPEFKTVTFNTGIDIETRPGSPVKAVARGRVEYADVLPGYGDCIILNHGGGWYTLYAHTTALFVSQGEQVERGSVIAEAGGGEAATPLHFEVRQSKKALDPAEWLGR